MCGFGWFVSNTMFHKETCIFFWILEYSCPPWAFCRVLHRAGTLESDTVTECGQPHGHHGHEVSFPGRRVGQLLTHKAGFTFLCEEQGLKLWSQHREPVCVCLLLLTASVAASDELQQVPACQECFHSDQPREFHVKKHGILWNGWNC